MTIWELGDWVYAERKKQKLTQEQLGEKAGFCNAHISHIEHGEKNFSFTAFESVVEALGYKYSIELEAK